MTNRTQGESLTRAAEALAYIPAEDRTVWVNMAYALKRTFGDDALQTWLEWSRRSDKFNERDAMACWRGAGQPGLIDIRHLFRTAIDHGWNPTPRKEGNQEDQRNTSPTNNQLEQKLLNADRKAEWAAKTAQRNYEAALDRATTHGYTARKGFPNLHVPVLNDQILLPMYADPWADNPSDTIRGVQRIQEDGTKRFAPRGCRIGGTRMPLRSRRTGGQLWWCEGYATGLAVQEALDLMQRDNDQVIIAFAAINLAKIAREGIVIADHDLYRCHDSRRCKHRWTESPYNSHPSCPKCGGAASPPTGERYARVTGLPYWLPPEPGDASDCFTAPNGLEILAGHLEATITAAAQEQPRRASYQSGEEPA